MAERPPVPTHRERIEALENSVATSNQASQERMAWIEALLERLSTTMETMQGGGERRVLRGRDGPRRDRRRREEPGGSRVSRESHASHARVHEERVSTSTRSLVSEHRLHYDEDFDDNDGHREDRDRREIGHRRGRAFRFNRRDIERHKRDGDRNEHRRRGDDYRRRNEREDERRQIERPRLEFPKFSDGDPTNWLNRVEQFWEHNPMDDHERVLYADYYLEDETNNWWQWLRRTYEQDMREITWRRFVREMRKQFGSIELVNYHGQFSKLSQKGPLREYIREFQRLMIKVYDWPEKVLIGCFVEGLKPELAVEVNYHKSKTLIQAMEFAKIKEEQLNRKRRARFEPRRPSASTQPTKPLFQKGLVRRSPNVTAQGGRPIGMMRQRAVPSGSGVRRLSWEELEAQRAKGLCFKCKEKFVSGHRCKTNQVYVIHSGDLNDDEDDIKGEEAKNDVGVEKEESVEVQDEEGQISIHALAEYDGPQTL